MASQSTQRHDVRRSGVPRDVVRTRCYTKLVRHPVANWCADDVYVNSYSSSSRDDSDSLIRYSCTSIGRQDGCDDGKRIYLGITSNLKSPVAVSTQIRAYRQKCALADAIPSREGAGVRSA